MSPSQTYSSLQQSIERLPTGHGSVHLAPLQPSVAHLEAFRKTLRDPMYAYHLLNNALLELERDALPILPTEYFQMFRAVRVSVRKYEDGLHEKVSTHGHLDMNMVLQGYNQAIVGLSRMPVGYEWPNGVPLTTSQRQWIQRVKNVCQEYYGEIENMKPRW